MSAALEVQKAVVAAVKGSGAFSALAGTRFYAEPPDAVTLPYASIAAVDSSPAARTHDSEGTDVAVTVHVWATIDTAVLRIMGAIKDALHDQDISLDTLDTVMGFEISQTVRRTDGPEVQGIQRFRFLVHP